MNDSLRTDVFLRFTPETIACACIDLAARALQVGDIRLIYVLYCCGLIRLLYRKILPGLLYSVHNVKRSIIS